MRFLTFYLIFKLQILKTLTGNEFNMLHTHLILSVQEGVTERVPQLLVHKHSACVLGQETALSCCQRFLWAVGPLVAVKKWEDSIFHKVTSYRTLRTDLPLSAPTIRNKAEAYMDHQHLCVYVSVRKRSGYLGKNSWRHVPWQGSRVGRWGWRPALCQC